MPNWKTDVHEQLARKKAAEKDSQKGPLQLDFRMSNEKRVPYGAKLKEGETFLSDIKDYPEKDEGPFQRAAKRRLAQN